MWYIWESIVTEPREKLACSTIQLHISLLKQIHISILLFGKNSSPGADNSKTAPRWRFRWVLLFRDDYSSCLLLQSEWESHSGRLYGKSLIHPTKHSHLTNMMYLSCKLDTLVQRQIKSPSNLWQRCNWEQRSALCTEVLCTIKETK